MSIEKCAFHADSRSSASEDISKLNRKATSVLQTNSVNEESKMGRNVEVLNLSLGVSCRPTSESTSLNSGFFSLLPRVLYDSWSLPLSIPLSILLCLHRPAISRVFTFVVTIRFSVLFRWLMLSLWPKIQHNFFYFAYRGAPKTAGP